MEASCIRIQGELQGYCRKWRTFELGTAQTLLKMKNDYQAGFLIIADAYLQN